MNEIFSSMRLEDNLDPNLFPPLTPVRVEQQLRLLNRQLDESQVDCAKDEKAYTDAKYAYEIRAATLMEELRFSPERRTVADKEAFVTLEARKELHALYDADSAIKITRSQIQKLRTQADIVRSLGASVKASMETA
jgi:hypothetical protein